MKKIGFIGGSSFLMLILVGAGCTGSVPTEIDSVDATQEELIIEENMPEYTFPGILDSEKIEDKQVRITTEKGDIVFTLFADTAPKTVSNFVYLTEGGYYDGLTFHRREEGFVIQGGDPSGNGSGGPGYSFEDELTDDREYTHGIVAMANRGPDTNGSQFFIMLDDVALPKLYTIFGEVTEGLDIVAEIGIGDVMTKVAIESVVNEVVNTDDDVEVTVDGE